MGELSDGPSGKEFALLRQLETNDSKGKSSLLAQERGFVRKTVAVVDLPTLRHEGTFPTEHQPASQDTISLRDLTGVLYGDALIEKINRTDWTKVGQQIDQFVAENPDLLKGLDISDIANIDPAQAATLAVEMASAKIKYALDLVPQYYFLLDEESRLEVDRQRAEGSYANKIATEMQQIDQMTVDELVSGGKGVCRHYSLVAMGVYEQLKKLDQSGRLKDTYFVELGNVAMTEGEDPHSYNLLIARRPGFDTVLSIADPTMYRTPYTTGEQENFTESRLASAVAQIAKGDLPEKLNIDRKDLESILMERIDRYERRLNQNGGEVSQAQIDSYYSTYTALHILNKGSLTEFFDIQRKTTLRILRLKDKAKDPEKFFQDILSSQHLRLGFIYGSIFAVNSVLNQARLLFHERPPHRAEDWKRLLKTYATKWETFGGSFGDEFKQQEVLFGKFQRRILSELSVH